MKNYPPGTRLGFHKFFRGVFGVTGTSPGFQLPVYDPRSYTVQRWFEQGKIEHVYGEGYFKAGNDYLRQAKSAYFLPVEKAAQFARDTGFDPNRINGIGIQVYGMLRSNLPPGAVILLHVPMEELRCEVVEYRLTGFPTRPGGWWGKPEDRWVWPLPER